MNSNTSNPDEAKEATDKSTKKNIPGLALLLLDLAVALVGFYIGTHVFWKDQNEEKRHSRWSHVGSMGDLFMGGIRSHARP